MFWHSTYFWFLIFECDTLVHLYIFFYLQLIWSYFCFLYNHTDCCCTLNPYSVLCVLIQISSCCISFVCLHSQRPWALKNTSGLRGSCCSLRPVFTLPTWCSWGKSLLFPCTFNTCLELIPLFIWCIQKHRKHSRKNSSAMFIETRFISTPCCFLLKYYCIARMLQIRFLLKYAFYFPSRLQLSRSYPLISSLYFS